MKHLFIILSTVLFLHSPFFILNSAHAGVIQLPQTGQTKCYDSAGAEIGCAGTGQDGNLRAGVAWPNPRFIDNNNGTVTDKLTGLVWLKKADCFSIEQTWANAINLAKTLASGTCGLTDGSVAGDWRLPNISELESLVDAAQVNPALPSGHPFINPDYDYIYWSSNYFKASQYGSAWIVQMNNGRVDSYPNYFGANIWPVRSGMTTSIIKLPLNP